MFQLSNHYIAFRWVIGPSLCQPASVHSTRIAKTYEVSLARINVRILAGATDPSKPRTPMDIEEHDYKPHDDSITVMLFPFCVHSTVQFVILVIAVVLACVPSRPIPQVTSREKLEFVYNIDSWIDYSFIRGV